MTLPNLLYLGADKAGSSSLQAILDDHPDAHVCPAKDTYYFTTEHHRGIEWYRRQFSPNPHQQVVAEICHDYLYAPEATARIADELGERVTLLVSLRDPIERAISSWLHYRKHGYSGDFDNAASRFPDILEHGDYGTHLARWYDAFPREQIVVMLFDDLRDDPAGFAASLYRRVGLRARDVTGEAVSPRRAASKPRNPLIAVAVKRAAVGVRQLGRPAVVGRIKENGFVQRLLYRPLERQPELPDETVRSLTARFAPEVDRAARLTGIDLLRTWPRYRTALVRATGKRPGV